MDTWALGLGRLPLSGSASLGGFALGVMVTGLAFLTVNSPLKLGSPWRPADAWQHTVRWARTSQQRAKLTVSRRTTARADVARVASESRLGRPARPVSGGAAAGPQQAGRTSPESWQAGRTLPESRRAGRVVPESQQAGRTSPESSRTGRVVPESPRAERKSPESSRVAGLPPESSRPYADVTGPADLARLVRVLSRSDHEDEQPLPVLAPRPAAPDPYESFWGPPSSRASTSGYRSKHRVPEPGEHLPDGEPAEPGQRSELEQPKSQRRAAPRHAAS
jgi:hypothetical protein